MKAVNTSGLTKNFNKLTALSNFDLSVEEGEILGFLGPADSGKTTLLRLISGLSTPTKGQCFIFERSVKDLKSVRELCGVVTRTTGLYENLYGIDNLLFFASLYEMDQTQARIKASSLMKKLDIWDKRETHVSDYSDGEKMRLSFARALLHEPKLLLYDMDNELVDAESEKIISELITEYNREKGMTVCIFSEDLGYIEKYCTGYVILNKGKFLAAGTYEYLRGLSKLKLTCRIRCNKKPAGFRICDEYIEKEIENEKEMPEILKKLILDGADVFEANVIYPKLTNIYGEIIEKGGDGQ